MARTDPSGDTRAWSDPNFRWMWRGSSGAAFGSEIGELAIPLVALITLAATPGELSVLRIVQFAPFVLATLPLGLLVDRHRRRPLVVGADLGRAAMLGLIPLGVLLGGGSLWWLYVLVAAIGVLTVLHQIADFAFLPSVVTADRLTDANSKITATQSAAAVGGAGAGGVLVQAVTAPLAVLVTAGTHLASALCLLRVRTDEQVPPPSSQSALGELRAGLRFLAREPHLRALLGEATLFNLANEIFMLGLTLYLIRDLGIGPAGFGLVLMVGALGSFLGAWFGTKATARFGYGRVLSLTLVVGNTAPLGVVLVDDDSLGSWVALGLVFLVTGLGIGMADAHATTVRQLATPELLRGRVNSAYRFVSWGVVPLGAAAGGLLIGATDARTAVIVGAGGAALATLFVVLSPVRTLRSVRELAPESA